MYRDNLPDLRQYLLPKIVRVIEKVIGLFLMLHTLFLVLFMIYGYTILWITNVFSVLIYLIEYVRLKFVLKDKKETLSLKKVYDLGVITIIELIIHMCIATCCLGSYYNFHLYIFGIIIIALLFAYLGLDMNKTGILMIFGCLSIVLSDIFIYLNNGSVYKTSNSDTLTLIFHYGNFLAIIMFTLFMTYWIYYLIYSFELNLAKKASYDKLTCLANRHYLDKLQFCSTSCAAIIDIDDFKKVNDTYGHDVGDKVLKHLSKMLRSLEQIDDNIIPLRWGGEEFVIIYNTDNYKFFTDIIETLRVDIFKSEVVINDELTIKYHITVGVANANEATDFASLIKCADNRLYYGKNHGKNQVIFED